MNEMCAFIGKTYEFLLALKKAGFTDELIQEIINSKNNEMAVKMFAAIVSDPAAESTINAIIFDFAVDYTRTVAEMVKVGKYDWSNNNITADHYPIPQDKAGKKEDINTKVFHFNRAISSADAVKEMEKEGYRPATAHEIMDFGEKNPELQRQFPIVALGSVWQYGILYRFVLVLGEGGSKRLLKLSFWDGGWADFYRFLAVRK